MWCTTRFNLGPLLFSIYINDMRQAVDSELLSYADDTHLVFQHRNIKTIEEHLNRDFPALVDWFVNNKLSVHFGEDKIKSILFSPKQIEIKRTNRYLLQVIKIKQYSNVTCLGCVLDECLTRKSMTMQTKMFI